MNQALRPTSFLKEFNSLGEDENKEPNTLQEEEEQFAHIARTDGWEKLKEYIEGVMEDLDLMVRASMDAGAGFEEIGRKTAVKEVTKDALRKIIDRVEDARTASDKRSGK